MIKMLDETSVATSLGHSLLYYYVNHAIYYFLILYLWAIVVLISHVVSLGCHHTETRPSQGH